MNKNYYQLLQYYRKCVRKFNRLSATNSKPKKRNLLRKRIEKTLQTLKAFRAGFKLKLATAGAAGILVVSGQAASAQTNFSAPQLSPFGMAIPTVYFNNPRFVDLDGDGDLDILNTNFGRDFLFSENTGTATAPAFSAEVFNPFGLATQTVAFSFYPADLDDDGDFDLMMGGGGSGGVNHLYFIENTGTATSPAFAAPVIDPFGIGSSSGRINPVMIDIDNDGDLDLMGGDIYLGWAFYENTGSASSPAFDSIQTNPLGLVPLPAPVNSYDSVADFADLDGDGDLDLLAGEFYGNFYYFENTGSNSAPAFAAPVTNPFGLVNVTFTSTVSFGDLDGDGDLDLLSRSEYNVGAIDGFRYFENTDISTERFEGFTAPELQVYPNPSSGVVRLAVNQQGNFILLNTFGQELESFQVVPGVNSLDFTDLPEGVYLLKDPISGQAAKIMKE